MDTKTSKKAILTLTGIVDMWRRHEELSARFAFANNSRDEAHMSTQVKRMSVRFLKRKSCFVACEQHRIIEEHEILVDLYTENQRELRDAEGTILISKQPRRWTLHDTIVLTRSLYFEELKEMATHLKHIPIHSDCKPRPWYALGRLPRKEARICILWVLNNIPGKPKRCLVW